MMFKLKFKESRLKIKDALKKIVPDHIGLTEDMPFDTLIKYVEFDDNIIIFEEEEYFEGRKAIFPKWILTSQCLDSRYKPKVVEPNEIRASLPAHLMFVPNEVLT